MKFFAIFLLSTSLVYGEEYRFFLSSKMEDGAENLSSAFSLANRICEAVPIPKNMLVRLGKSIGLEFPFAIWIATVQHEYFGHGARAREFGIPTSYSIYPPWECWPWGNKRSYIYYENYPQEIEKSISLTTSGIEGNNVFAHQFQKRLYSEKSISHYELILFLTNKLYINYRNR